MYDVLIVGGGAAGYAAGIYAARAGLRTLVLTGDEPGGQMGIAETVENYPGTGALDGPKLAEDMRRDAQRAGVELRMERAVEVSLREYRVRTARETYEGRTLIYAAGASPRRLEVPGEERFRGRGVSWCAACDGAFFRGKDVAVVGGGSSAVSEALTLSHVCRRVYLLHRRDALRAERRLTERLEEAENVTLLWNVQVEAVLGRETVTGLAYRELPGGCRRELPCAGVFVAAGRKPNTELLQGQLELDAGGYVPADETTRTAVPGVFAAGDVRTKAVRQVVTAAADGAVAALMAAKFLQNPQK